MRIRRSVTRLFVALVVPSICAAITLYFGYYLFLGSRSLFALTDAQARLAVAQARLADIQHQNAELKHRIDLVGAGDPDIIEEIAREQMLGSTPGQVAVPRDHH